MVNNEHVRRRTVAGLACAAALGCRAPDVTVGRYQGMIEYDERELAFEAPGRVVVVAVQRGQRVEAGAVIARQDDAIDRDLRAVDAGAVRVAEAELALVAAGSRGEDVRAAEAQLIAARAAEKNAQLELERQRALVAKGALPGAGLDALDAQLAAAIGARRAQEERLQALRRGARAEEIARAAARLDQLKRALELDDRRIEKRALVAPTAGVVQDVYLQSGEIAGAGVPVLAIADVRRPYADVFVPVPEVPRVRIGDVAALRVEGLDEDAVGVVELIHAEAEFTPRFVFSPRERPNLMVRVRLRVDDRAGRLHAGLPAYATFPPRAAGDDGAAGAAGLGGSSGGGSSGGRSSGGGSSGGESSGGESSGGGSSGGGSAAARGSAAGGR
jgi:HlyD family secretion protein